MNLLVGIAAGIVLGLLESALRGRTSAAPDLAAVALAILLLHGSPRRTAARCTGVLLGVSSCSLDPVGAFLLGGGIAALVLLPLRELVFVESATTQAVFGASAALALALGRALYAAAGLAPSLPWSAQSWTSPLLAAVAVPILLRAGSELRRMARWSAARIGGSSDASAGAPPD